MFLILFKEYCVSPNAKDPATNVLVNIDVGDPIIYLVPAYIATNAADLTADLVLLSAFSGRRRSSILRFITTKLYPSNKPVSRSPPPILKPFPSTKDPILDIAKAPPAAAPIIYGIASKVPYLNSTISNFII